MEHKDLEVKELALSYIGNVLTLEKPEIINLLVQHNVHKNFLSLSYSVNMVVIK